MCVAAIAVLKIGPVADLVNRGTGGIRLDELAGHLLGVGAAALTLGWLARLRNGSGHPRWRAGSSALVLLALVLTWFLGPVYEIPAGDGWIPEDVLNAPVLVLHWLVLDVFMIVFAVLVVRTVGSAVPAAPSGRRSLALRLIVAAAAALATTFVIAIAGRVAALVSGDGTPDWTYVVQNILLALVFLTFLLAVAIPATTRRGPHARTRSSAWIGQVDPTGA